jgi:hypothetical protein
MNLYSYNNLTKVKWAYYVEGVVLVGSLVAEKASPPSTRWQMTWEQLDISNSLLTRIYYLET